MRPSVLLAALTLAVMTAGAAVHAQKTTPVHPGKAGSPHIRTVGSRRRQHLDRIGRPSLKGRAPMTLGKAPAAAEQLTFSIQDTQAGGALHIDWGTTRATIPFTVG
jgi:hypothetical protein